MAQKYEEAGAPGGAADLQNVIGFPTKDPRIAIRIAATLQGAAKPRAAAEFQSTLWSTVKFGRSACDRDLAFVLSQLEAGLAALNYEKQCRQRVCLSAYGYALRKRGERRKTCRVPDGRAQ